MCPGGRGGAPQRTDPGPQEGAERLRGGGETGRDSRRGRGQRGAAPAGAPGDGVPLGLAGAVVGHPGRAVPVDAPEVAAGLHEAGGGPALGGGGRHGLGDRGRGDRDLGEHSGPAPPGEGGAADPHVQGDDRGWVEGGLPGIEEDLPGTPEEAGGQAPAPAGLPGESAGHPGGCCRRATSIGWATSEQLLGAEHPGSRGLRGSRRGRTRGCAVECGRPADEEAAEAPAKLQGEYPHHVHRSPLGPSGQPAGGGPEGGGGGRVQPPALPGEPECGHVVHRGSAVAALDGLPGPGGGRGA